jgi:hypothetical protein
MAWRKSRANKFSSHFLLARYGLLLVGVQDKFPALGRRSPVGPNKKVLEFVDDLPASGRVGGSGGGSGSSSGRSSEAAAACDARSSNPLSAAPPPQASAPGSKGSNPRSGAGTAAAAGGPSSPSVVAALVPPSGSASGSASGSGGGAGVEGCGFSEERVAGLHLPGPPGSRFTVLYSHGNAEDLSLILDYLVLEGARLCWAVSAGAHLSCGAHRASTRVSCLLATQTF